MGTSNLLKPGQIINTDIGPVRIRYYFPPTCEYDVEELNTGILTVIPKDVLEKYVYRNGLD